MSIPGWRSLAPPPCSLRAPDGGRHRTARDVNPGMAVIGTSSMFAPSPRRGRHRIARDANSGMTGSMASDRSSRMHEHANLPNAHSDVGSTVSLYPALLSRRKQCVSFDWPRSRAGDLATSSSQRSFSARSSKSVRLMSNPPQQTNRHAPSPPQSSTKSQMPSSSDPRSSQTPCDVYISKTLRSRHTPCAVYRLIQYDKRQRTKRFTMPCGTVTFPRPSRPVAQGGKL